MISNNNDSDADSADFVCLLDKTTIQELKSSFQSSSNLTTNKMFKEAWEKNTEYLNDNALNHVLNCSRELMKQNTNSDNTQSWTNSVSNFSDPVSLFENSLTKCQYCSNINYNKTIKNIVDTKCLCNGSRHPESSSQESTSGEIRSFVPKFRTKSKKTSLLNKNWPIASDSGIEAERNVVHQKHVREYDLEMDKSSGVDVEKDEEKAHKNQVAKIIFKSAREQLLGSNPAAKRSLGASRRAQSKFISPMLSADKQEVTESAALVNDDRLKHIDPKMIEIIESEILDRGTPVGWDDIAGLEHAKAVIQEAVVWPLLRPDIFTGLRRPPRGVLLFGPPGTGKTLIGKCVAAQCNATFFSISASSLTSKWIGDGEKMVRALFAVARCHQPAVIFIDEIDSLLTQRNDSEHEASRRMKTEFLVQLDGAATGDEDQLLIVGATNRPQELDEAARRRLVKRLYIPLPDLDARCTIIKNLLKNENHSLSPQDIDNLANMTAGYSGADMRSVCSEAAMGPIRSVPLSQIVSIDRNKVRPVNMNDFETALQRVRPSVSQDDLGQYVKWNNTYGQGL